MESEKPISAQADEERSGGRESRAPRPGDVEAIASSRRDYLPLLDLLRLVAGLSVVHHHMTKGLLFGVGLGLPLFLVLFFALAAISKKQEGLSGMLRRKGGDLIIPWLRWSVFYVLLLVVTDGVRGGGPTERLEMAMLWTGGHPALWFLPFAAAALLPAHALGRLLRDVPRPPAVLILIVCAFAATAAAQVVLRHGIPDPWTSWVRASPAIPWGLAVGTACRADSPGRRRGLLTLISASAALGFFAFPEVAHPNDLPRRMAIAVPLVCLGFTYRGALPGAVRRLAVLSFGVYLVHPFVGKVLIEFFDVHSWPPVVHGLVAWTISLALIQVARASGLRWRELRPDPPARRPAVTP